MLLNLVPLLLNDPTFLDLKLLFGFRFDFFRLFLGFLVNEADHDLDLTLDFVVSESHGDGLVDTFFLLVSK